jgi:hypothetical protein
VDFSGAWRPRSRSVRTYTVQRHRRLNHVMVFPQLRGTIVRESANTDHDQDPSLCRFINGGPSVGLAEELIDLGLEEEVLIEAHTL